MNDKNNKHEDERDSIFGDLIHSYSRAQAIEDGVLMAVDPQAAQQAGFKIPVALTYAAWASVIPVPEHLKKDPEQSEAGRMADLLRVLRFNIRNYTTGAADQVDFKIELQQPDGSHERVCLKAIIGPGDKLEAVLTIMLPDED